MDLSPMADDSLTVSGLSLILDEADPPPYLQLRIECRGSVYRAAVLAAGEDWGLNVRDDQGKAILEEPELYPTQSGAILAALLAVLSLSPS